LVHVDMGRQRLPTADVGRRSFGTDVVRAGGLTRREALALLGVGGAALSLSGCDWIWRPTADDSDKALDVAVVGGGVSGLYVAWSLLTRDPSSSSVLPSSPRVAVFERSDRLGGRLYSVVPPRAPHLRAEMGAMRVLTRQRIVGGLVDALGLPKAPFPFGGGNNLLYLRGRRFTLDDMRDGAPVVPYRLPQEERGLTTEELLVGAIESYVPNAAEMTEDEWTAAKKTLEANGSLLIDQSMRRAMRAALSPAGFELIDHGDGYDSFEERHNAAELMQTLSAEFKDPVYYRPADGMAAIPMELAARVLEAGGAIRTGTRLRRLERAGSSADPTIRLTLESDDGRTVEARHVVLALPKGPILSLDRRSLPFASPRFTSDVDAVTAVPASKLLLAYRENWWGKLGITSGRSLTDLPVHQCIYFGTERGSSNSLLTATYNDGEDLSYFERFLRQEEPFESHGELPDDLITPRALVLAVQPQLAKLHGTPVPAPYWAAYKDWRRDPIGAGWHFWKVGRRSWEVIPRIRKPLADANLYVCGEAWSTSQGWVEGALNSSERVLQDHLGLPRPPWLGPGVQLGP
jgi:monoamine oxidase